MSDTVIAQDGTRLDLAALPTTLVWSGTQIQTISVTAAANITGIPTVYTQTFTYTGGQVTGITGWVPA
jgi:hypothetical protein